MKYPILYKSNEIDFFTMGLGPIEMLKATVTQERNGIFVFEGEILTDNPLFPLVLENCIIKVDADHLLKDQRFRIKRIVPNHNGKAEIYAEHVSYLSRELTIKPEVNITGSAQVALNQWKASIVEANPFVVSSDITTSAITKWRIDKVSNPMMALGGVEGSILDRWGGEYLFDNYHISLLKKRGKTATNILAYGRNITDFEQERNILSTYTSVAPYAIYTDDREREVIITVDGYVVDSEHINKYPNRVTKPIDFSSEFGSDEIPTKARLTTLAQQYIKDNEIGVPTTSIKISFLDLSQTADYADYAFLEQVNLCDDVRVHYPKLGVNTIAKVVRVVWNCLTESYDEIEIGQKRMSLASQIQEQNKVIQEINTQTNQAQVSADGKNMIFYGLYGENGLGEPSATKIGDSWFKPNGLETELYVWTGIEWKLIMSTSSFGEIEETIKGLDEELELTTTTANDAVNKAQQAIESAGFANDIANETVAILADVKVTVDNAKINADNAILDAQNALNKAIKSSVIHYAISENGTTPPATGWKTTNPDPTAAQYVWTRTTITLNDNSPIVSYSVGKIGVKGDQGLKGDTGGQGIQGVPGANAPTITSVVQQFYLSTSTTTQTGGSWLATVPVWSSGKYYWVRVATTYSNGSTTTSTPVLDNALNDSLVTALEVKTANQNLSTTVTQHATLIEGKANSTTVDVIEGRVTTAEGSITTMAGEVELKANSADVNALTGRVTTAEGNITTQAGLIELKANQSVVDTLTGRVSTTESKITATDGKVTTLTTKTDGHTTSIGQLQTSYNGLSSTVTQVRTDLDGMEIGGRNYFSVKAWENRPPFSVSGISALKIQLEPDTEYVMSTNIPTWADNATCDLFVFNSDATPNSVVNGVALNKPRKVTTLADGFAVIAMRNREFSSEAFWAMLSKGNKALDWTPAPEDLTTVKAFSALEQNLNGFQQVVQNTYADKTTVTALATQWTQTTELANGHTSAINSLGDNLNLRVTTDEFKKSMGLKNLIVNSGNLQNTLGWSGNIVLAKHVFYKNNSANLFCIRNATTSESTASSSYFNILPSTEYTLKFTGFAGSNVKDMDVWLLSRKKGSASSYDKSKLLITTNLSPSGLDTRTITFTTNDTDDQAFLRFDNNGSTNGNESLLFFVDVMLVKGSVAPNDWFSAESDDIITQINLSPESLLIASNKVYIDGETYIANGVIKRAMIGDLEVTGAKIANATIGSAKIINIDASKVTAETLSAIQTKTGNLEVTGWLDFSTENRGLRGSYDFGDTYGGAYDARWFDGSFRLSHRHFVFTGNNYEVNPNNTKGRHLGYSESFQGQDYLKFRTWNYDGGTMYGRVDITSTYINMSNRYDTTNINFDSTNGNGYFRGLLSVNDVTVGTSANLQVYDVNAHDSSSNIYFNSRRSDLADFRIGVDGVGRTVQSLAVYNRTYSSAANMFVTDSGTIGRSVSARKYKILIEESMLLDKAKNFLQIKPKNWYDKVEVESVANALNQWEDIESSAQAIRHHGFIADELDEIGLNEVVQYGADGQVEGLAYDRLTIYYHELIKDLYKRIEVLENGQTNSDY